MAHARSYMSLPALKIGNLTAKIPIVQGGMGIRISLAGLASAVANQGGIGVIAGAMIGIEEKDVAKDPAAADRRALAREIQAARAKTKGLLGVNIMVALTNFATLVRTALAEKIDFIFVGAGLPLDLPAYVREAADKAQEEIKTKLVPIVSSARAAALIAKKWLASYGVLPDAVVLEGPRAGGHLGFQLKELDDPEFSLARLTPQVLEALKPFEDKKGAPIPLISGGGVYTGADLRRQLELGAAGVQMGTRFVATDECDAARPFKEALVAAKTEDSIIIQSPVGMPGRAVQSAFLEAVLAGVKKPVKCPYKCLKTCNPQEAPYCISQALISAKRGRFSRGFVFAGANVGLVDRIVSVKTVVEEIMAEYEASGPTALHAA